MASMAVVREEERCMQALEAALMERLGAKATARVFWLYGWRGLSLSEAIEDVEQSLDSADLRDTQACVRHGGA